MDDDLKITLQDEDGQEQNYFIVYTFDNLDNTRHYTIYTDYKEDDEGNISYYAMYQDDTDEEGVFHPCESDEDWELVDSVLSSFLEE